MSNMIQQIEDSIKKNLNHKTIIMALSIALLTSTLLFGLGYLAGQDAERAPIIIQQAQ